MQKGQLGRLPSPMGQESSHLGQSCSSSRYANPRTPWYSIPGAIPNVGPRYFVEMLLLQPQMEPVTTVGLCNLQQENNRLALNLSPQF